MQRAAIFLLIVGIALTAGCSHAVASPPDSSPHATQSPPPIPYWELNQRAVEGQLGIRLGTIVEIAGTIVPNTSQRKADSDAPFFLSIESVNGRRLSKPVQFRFVKATLWTEIEEPRIGDRFRYMAYETGGFGALFRASLPIRVRTLLPGTAFRPT